MQLNITSGTKLVRIVITIPVKYQKLQFYIYYLYKWCCYIFNLICQDSSYLSTLCFTIAQKAIGNAHQSQNREFIFPRRSRGDPRWSLREVSPTASCTMSRVNSDVNNGNPVVPRISIYHPRSLLLLALYAHRSVQAKSGNKGGCGLRRLQRDYVAALERV